MRFAVLVVGFAAVGCGDVKEPADAAPQGMHDAPALCTNMTLPSSCGPTCAMCTVTSDREVPACVSAACASTCKNDAPRCTDNSCSRVAWTFESASLEGATPRAPAGLSMQVRPFMNSSALALDVTNLAEVSFTLPVCLGGTINAAPKTLSARVYFQGGTATGEQYYVQ